MNPVNILINKEPKLNVILRSNLKLNITHLIRYLYIYIYIYNILYYMLDIICLDT